MRTAQWEFTSGEWQKGICVDRRRHRVIKHRKSSAKPASPSAAGMHRQSGLLIVIRTFRHLPLCTTLSGAIIWLVSLFLPQPIRWWTGAWSAGLLGLALSAVFSGIGWLCSKWEFNGERFTLSQGVITRQELSLHRGRVVHVNCRTTPLTALFRCGWLYIYTAQSSPKHSVKLLLTEGECILLSGQLCPAQSGRFHSYRAGSAALWLASLGGEGTAAFVSAAVSSFSVLRDTMGEQLHSQFNHLTQMRGFVGAAAALLAALWLTKVLHTRLTFGRMTHYRRGDMITLGRGILSRQTERINRREVCALDIRCSLLSLMSGRQSCSLVTPGRKLLPYLPPVDNRRLRIETAVISPHSVRVCTVSPLSGGIAYGAGRWALCLCVLPLTSLVRRLFPSFDGAFYVIGITAAILLLWRALTTTVCAQRAGLTLFADCLEVTGVRHLTIHTLRVFRPSIGMIRITQSPLSRLMGTCTVKVIPRGKAASLACIKIPFERTSAVCEKAVK